MYSQHCKPIQGAIEEIYILSNINPFSDNIILFKRNIDYVYLLCNDKSKLPAFFEWLSQVQASIKFVKNFDMGSLNFLDTVVYVNASRKLFKTYIKFTDKNSFLHYKSHHPRQLINNLPYGQFLRVKRKSTCQQDYYHQKTCLSLQLRARGYP